MFYEKKDNHRFYNFVDEILSDSHFDIGVVKTRIKTRHFRGVFNNFKFLIIFWDIFYIPYASYKLKNKDFIFIREFTTPTFVFSAILLYPLRKKILLNVNHNFQRFEHRVMHRLSIKLIDALGISFFIFEYEGNPLKLCNKIISIPFLIQNMVLPNVKKLRPTIGVVGAYRKEKKIEETISALLNVHLKTDSFDVVFGCNKQELLDIYKNKNITLLNTTSLNNYNLAINSVDILLFNYSQSDYKIRHSGVLTDAVFKGKVVIAPDFPVFKQQLSEPERVGINFTHLDDLHESINDAIKLYLSSDLKEKFLKYSCYRNLASVSSKLDDQLRIKYNNT